MIAGEDLWRRLFAAVFLAFFGDRSTEATRSPSAVENTITPWVERPAMRMPSTGQRINWPPSVTSMIWSLSSTGNDATSRPVLFGDRHGDDAFAAAAGGAVLVRRRALAEAFFGDRQHELLRGRQVHVALPGQARWRPRPPRASAPFSSPSPFARRAAPRWRA